VCIAFLLLAVTNSEAVIDFRENKEVISHHVAIRDQIFNVNFLLG
jgi:hypothetical protein